MAIVHSSIDEECVSVTEAVVFLCSGEGLQPAKGTFCITLNLFPVSINSHDGGKVCSVCISRSGVRTNQAAEQQCQFVGAAKGVDFPREGEERAESEKVRSKGHFVL